MKRSTLFLSAMIATMLAVHAGAADQPAIQQSGQQFQQQPASVIAVQQQPAVRQAMREVSLVIDQKAGLYKYQMEIGRSQSATDGAMALGELCSFLQIATGADVEAMTMTKSGQGYLATVAIKAPAESSALMPVVPGLIGIAFGSNCPTNSHFEAQFSEGGLAKLTEDQKKMVEKSVVALSAFNHHLPAKAQAKTNRKTELKDKWTIEADFPTEAFQSQISLIQQPFQVQPTGSLFIRQQGS